MQNNGLLGCFWWFWTLSLHTLGVQVESKKGAEIVISTGVLDPVAKQS